jgi:YQGE family putative transporter
MQNDRRDFVLSFRELPHPLRILLVIGALFTLATALSGAFVNVYLWRQNQSLIILALYNGLQYLMMPVAFYLGRFFRPRRMEPFLRLGIFFHALFYASVLLFGNRPHSYLLGILLGTGAGFYWFSFNLLVLRIARGRWRVVFNSYLGVSSSLANMAAPLFAGFLIEWIHKVTGYSWIFAASLILFAFAFLISAKLRGEIFAETPAPLFCRRHPNWNRVLIGSFFQGLREGVFTFLAAILVYLTTKNEASLGQYAALTSLISSLSFFVVGKILRWNWYNESMLIGSFFSTGAIALFIFRMDYSAILLYGLITALFTPLFTVPFGTRVFQVIDEAHHLYEREYIVEREITLNVGRVLSIASFMAAYAFLRKEWIPLYLILIGFMQVIAVLVLRSVRMNDPGGGDHYLVVDLPKRKKGTLS